MSVTITPVGKLTSCVFGTLSPVPSSSSCFPLVPCCFLHLLFFFNILLLCLPGTFGCGANSISSGSFYSVAMVSVPECVDSGTQTDITFQNMVAAGKSRTRHHQHQHRGRSPSPPPPSPPLPHLMALEGMEELYVFTCFRWLSQTGPVRSDGWFFSVFSCVLQYDGYVDVSNQEVDRQDELEYEVRHLLPQRSSIAY